MWSSKRTIRTLLLGCTLATASVVAGCGFQPMYARSNNGDALKTAMAAVDVGIIEDRQGQMLRNALERRFEQGAGNTVQKRYRLTVKMTEVKTESGFRKDATSTRESVTLTTTSKLESGGKVVWTRQHSAMTGYNITADHFTVEMAYRNARERTIEQLSDQISEAVAVFLKQNPSLGAAPAGSSP